MRHSIISLLAILIIVFFSTAASAGWLVFHKPAFRGKVIDAETKELIEGAVVVAVYKTHSIIGTPAGGWSSVIEVKETLTDKSGEFSFPSYKTLTNPNAREDQTDFIIYKPGYGSFPGFQISPPPPYVGHETHFSEKRGSRIEFQKNLKTITFIAGIVELPKVKAKNERLRAIPGSPTGFRSEELPLLYKAINAEGKRFGLGEVK